MDGRAWKRVGIVAMAVGLGAAGCGDGDAPAASPTIDPPMAFDSAVVALAAGADTIPLTVELARTADERAYGLMERESLPADRGMLFLYPEPRDSTAGFYMYRTLIPLDIAFMDDDGVIVSILSMTPCESPNPRVCRGYGPGVPFTSALEVNAGYFDRHGVDVGDRLLVDPTLLGREAPGARGDPAAGPTGDTAAEPGGEPGG